MKALRVDWKEIKAVIFDVDGTLYTQSKLRKKMLFALLAYYAVRPWRLKEMLLLQHFRQEREKRPGDAGPDLENAQYLWCAQRGNYEVAKIKKVVDQWIFNYPNRYLASCTYPGTQSFFEVLKQNGIKIAIYSDYKAHDKLKAMGLPADLIVSSTDPEIDRLKPDPKGLLYIAEKLQLAPQACLFIGDRPELDGECAIRAKMPYRIVDKKPFDQFDFYTNLQNELTSSLKPNIYESGIYST
ncbi:MAG: family hydrolase [Adhaeribacter sp.]|nr:family hydrolase [Adhaeribacter sp.]